MALNPLNSSNLEHLASKGLNEARGSGERCKLPQRGLGEAASEIEFSAF